MKQLILTCLIVLIGTIGYAQNDDAAPTADGPIMSFETMTVDYGTIEEGADPLRKVKFTNTGTQPLIIKNARGSCGCTVPTWPKEPIMPGESSDIEVRYDTRRVGKISKTIRITTNEGGDAHVLKVVGKINKKADQKALPESEEPGMMSGGK